MFHYSQAISDNTKTCPHPQGHWSLHRMAVAASVKGRILGKQADAKGSDTIHRSIIAVFRRFFPHRLNVWIMMEEPPLTIS